MTKEQSNTVGYFIVTGIILATILVTLMIAGE